MEEIPIPMMFIIFSFSSFAVMIQPHVKMIWQLIIIIKCFYISTAIFQTRWIIQIIMTCQYLISLISKGAVKSMRVIVIVCIFWTKVKVVFITPFFRIRREVTHINVVGKTTMAAMFVFIKVYLCEVCTTIVNERWSLRYSWKTIKDTQQLVQMFLS